MKKHLGLVLAATCSATIMVAPQAAAEPVTQERCVALIDAVQDATGAQRTAEDTERAAQEALAQAQRDVDAAEQERTASANMVADAERALDAATKERDAAKGAVPEGVTVASASKGLEDAKAGAEAARTALEESKAEAKAQFDRGSLGFFEAMGADDAVAELHTDYRYPKQDPFSGQTGYRIADDTRIGAADDATHLDNMKAAIAWLPEANELRESDGQPALPVADVLMAQAQVNINWSQQLPRGHSDNGWDNLSWNYENPFDGWFHRERPIYFEAQQQGRDPFSAGAGHYMALVNPDMRATGFAVNTEEFYHDGYPWTVAHAQTFAYDQKPETTYSVAEYTERFNTYYDGLVHAIEHGDAAKRQALDEREAEVTDAQQILEAAYALDAAEQIVTTRAQELAAAKEAQPAREAAAAEALNEAKQVVTTRAQEAQAARAAAAEARAKTEAAQSAYQPVKQECAKLTGADKDGSSTGGIIAGVVLGLLAVIGIVVALNPGLLPQF
ncbi:CAP domain-containing protein [Corynebacterium sp. HMSC074A01]|uniref:CAP domain-containing protein n=1 Tax=Corynebacterium sp. HMSC074A01 TaxID=1715030 RepID=UPI000B13088D|nr:CAP domain-containing protein [Corynebacterium sp. HMSC074A01]